MRQKMKHFSFWAIFHFRADFPFSILIVFIFCKIHQPHFHFTADRPGRTPVPIKKGPCFTHDPNKGKYTFSESRRKIKNIFSARQSTGPPFAFGSVKWGVRYFTHDSDEGDIPSPESCRWIETFSRRKQIYRAAVLFWVRKMGVGFLHAIQTEPIILCLSCVGN